MVASTATRRLGSVPIPRTRLIGRERERATARSLLLEEAVPLLTLTGPGGTGKTRLALAIAADVGPQFADGVIWVDLAPLAAPVLIPETIASALSMARVRGVLVEEQVVQHLRSRGLPPREPSRTGAR